MKFSKLKSDLVLSGKIIVALLLLCGSKPKPCEAWFGYEISTKAAVAANPYAPAGAKEDGSALTLDGRFMLQTSGAAALELHALAIASRYTGLLDAGDRSASPFRAWDLETERRDEAAVALSSEFDRLNAGLKAGGIRVTVGRQAVTWGEAYYFNIGDVFGAFPLLETNRLHKPGIDAVTSRLSLGPFSSLEAAAVPETGQGDTLVFRWTGPLGGAGLSFTAGKVCGDDVAVAGLTADVGGAKAYGSWLLTAPEAGDGFSQAVLGVERQAGPRTHFVCEIHRNGWGTDDPSGYPALALDDRFLSGRVQTLGRDMAALSVDRQLTALLTGAAAVFANIADGSALVRLTASRSLSDLADLTFGASFGVGERPRGLETRSEYGSAPVTVFMEAVATF